MLNAGAYPESHAILTVVGEHTRKLWVYSFPSLQVILETEDNQHMAIVVEMRQKGNANFFVLFPGKECSRIFFIPKDNGHLV